MHVFIAGVMQGARLDEQINDQGYRVRISEALQTHLPNIHIIDPWALNPGSVNYDEARARRTFLDMTSLAGEADLLIAYLPTVSMGTAMEMWQAFQSKTYIVAVTPHVHQWAIRFTADEVLPDLESLIAKIQDGHFSRVIRMRRVDVAEDAD
jgi:hypothetical protein